MVQIAGSMPTDAGTQKFQAPVNPADGVPKIQRARGVSGDYGAGEVVPAFNSGSFMFEAATPGFTAGAVRGDVVFIGGTPYTVEFAIVEASSGGTDNTIVAARTGPNLKIRLLGYDMLASGALSVRWRSGTTPLTGPMPFAANGGKIAPFSPVGHVITAAGQPLNLFLSGAVTVGGHIVFIAHP